MRKLLFLWFTLALFSSCEKDTAQTTNYYHLSYRSHLWSMLNYANWEIDFIGTQYDAGKYHPVRLHDFDRDHQGVSGIQSTQVLAYLETVLNKTGAPDVVLLGVGINDIFLGRSALEVASTIEEIIAVFRAYNPRVHVFVEQVAPTVYSEDVKTNLVELERMNELIGTLAYRLNKAEAGVIAVDMHTEWKNRYFIDDIHYNALGSIEVASRYYDAMIARLPTNQPYKIMAIGDSRVEGSRPEN